MLKIYSEESKKSIILKKRSRIVFLTKDDTVREGGRIMEINDSAFAINNKTIAVDNLQMIGRRRVVKHIWMVLSVPLFILGVAELNFGRWIFLAGALGGNNLNCFLLDCRHRAWPLLERTGAGTFHTSS